MDSSEITAKVLRNSPLIFSPPNDEKRKREKLTWIMINFMALSIHSPKSWMKMRRKKRKVKGEMPKISNFHVMRATDVKRANKARREIGRFSFIFHKRKTFLRFEIGDCIAKSQEWDKNSAQRYWGKLTWDFDSELHFLLSLFCLFTTWRRIFVSLDGILWP